MASAPLSRSRHLLPLFRAIQSIWTLAFYPSISFASVGPLSRSQTRTRAPTHLVFNRSLFCPRLSQVPPLLRFGHLYALLRVPEVSYDSCFAHATRVAALRRSSVDHVRATVSVVEHEGLCDRYLLQGDHLDMQLSVVLLIVVRLSESPY